MFDETWNQMRKMQRELDEMFNEWRGFAVRGLLPDKSSKELQNWSPAAMDIKETGKEVIARFDMPGIDKNDIELHVNENSISVKAEKKSEVKEEKNGFVRHERSYSGFYRSAGLPSRVVPEHVHAEYKNGVLMVTMPKAQQGRREKGRKIPVK